MTNTYLTNITPDSFSGLLFGFEGVKNTVVLMNGPTGCKFYHSATADNQTLRQMEFDPLNYPELLYFGQPRIPCTYLDKRDYVYGSQDKLEEAIRFLEENLSFDLLVVVNSPGAALIGDDLEGILTGVLTKNVPVITVETPGYSHHIWEGYSAACMELLKKFTTEDKETSKPTSHHTMNKSLADNVPVDNAPADNSPAHTDSARRPVVNLLGMSIFHKYYQGDVAELKRLLGLVGIDVNCALCCESTVKEIRRVPEADLNIVLDSAYGLESAEWLKTKFNIPYICCNDGLPVGFRSTENFIRQVCHALKLPAEAMDGFITEGEKARARSYIYLSRINSLTGLPKGAKFAVQGTSAQCLAYAKFFITYFGMAADSICVLDSPAGTNHAETRDSMALGALLRTCGMEGALDKNILSTDAELVFADGNIIAKLKARGLEFSGIETALPSLGYIDVIPKTHLGLQGALLLCEQVINGLMY